MTGILAPMIQETFLMLPGSNNTELNSKGLSLAVPVNESGKKGSMDCAE
jgi:hypothetical protein